MTKTAVTKPSKAFEFDGLSDLLSDPVHAAAYLEECLADDNIDQFQQALRDVAKAQNGGVSAVAASAELGRESLYKSLNAKGNPQLGTISKVLGAMGMRLSVQPSAR